ncbi:MAG: hypothetical protein ACYTFQ_31625 [Planctomycetota bacterium]
MARARYTVRNLRDDIDRINDWCYYDNIPLRLEVGGRNGYQAVDEYPVDADGKRIGTGVNRNVECGSSRECSHAAFAWYGAQVQKSR